MMRREEIDKLREYLKSNGTADLYNSDWYWLNGLQISIDAGIGGVFVYLTRDKWLIACNRFMPRSSDNPHKVMVLDFAGMMRLIEGGEMAYNNIENEQALDELQ